MSKQITRTIFFLIGIAVLLTTSIWFETSPGRAAAVAKNTLQEPVTDLVADALEITQSVQDLNNSVPLVAGKRTFVRLYVHSTNGIHPTTAILRVEMGQISQTILPIKPGGPLINVRPAYNRALPSHAFLFELPLWATFAIFNDLTLTAEVNPDLRWHPRNPEEFNYANNTISRTVHFTQVPKLHLVIVDQPYILGNQTYSSRLYDRWMAVDWIRRAYPLSQVKGYFRTLPAVKGELQYKDNKWTLGYPNCGWLNAYMLFTKSALYGSPMIPNIATFLGMVTDEGEFMRGCAPLGGVILGINSLPVRVASTPAGDATFGWDLDGTYADWYSGHEVGHAWFQSHVRGGPGYVEDGCGGEKDAVTQYPNGKISPTGNIFDPTAVFGFDPLRLAQGLNPVLGPYWSDMMTYCNYQWISKPTFVSLKNVFTIYSLPSMTNSISQPDDQEVLSIFSVLDPSSGEVSMLPVFVVTTAAELAPPEPGSYAIVLRGAAGEELSRYPFTPIGLEAGAAPFEGDEAEAAYIALQIPNMSDIARLELEGPGGNVIYQVEAGLNHPSVQVISPNGGEIFSGAPIRVSWNASDIDGDPLTFNVAYSADNGASWETVAQFITQTHVTIDQVNLPASDTALFRVSASDGIHTAVDQSDGVFFIPNHIPTGEIIAPAADTTIASGQTVTFEAQVYDYDLGFLDDGNLQWWSDRDGLLGNGATLSTASLSQGLHEINLIADDGHGQYIIDQIIVTVVSTPNNLPPQPDQLVAGPDLVFLYPSDGVSSATIYLDNLNLGIPLAWSVTSDAGWVELSATSGRTPMDITVSTTLSGNDFGTHRAVLTFSDPNGVYEPVHVDVVVTIPEYNVYMPMLNR